MPQDVTVYVSTLDQWSMVWPGFCHGLHKYWWDCPWPVAFSTETLDAPCSTSLKVGVEEHWARRNRKALEKIDSSVVLFMIEDFWLTEPVDTAVMLEFADLVKRGEADYIVLAYGNQDYNSGIFALDERLFHRSKEDFYRLTLQAAFWRKDVLLDLLGDDIATPWAFEQAGRDRSQNLVCLATQEYRFLKYVERSIPEFESGAVLRGKWMPSAKLYAEREGLAIDFSVNPNGTYND